MYMYTLAITTLIDHLRASCPEVRQAWYGDDATGASTCTGLRSWWNELANHGPSFEYHPDGSKTYLVVKQEYGKLPKQHLQTQMYI